MPPQHVSRDLKEWIPILFHAQHYKVKEICEILGVQKSLVYQTVAYHTSQRTLQPRCRFCWLRMKSHSKSYGYKAHQESSKSTTLFVPRRDLGGIAPAPRCLCFHSHLAKDPASSSFFSKSCLCPCASA